MNPVYKPYTAIGSRKTPLEIMDKMKAIAMYLQKQGFTLRSGAAGGADTAFENGVTDQSLKEIFLPWKGFSGNTSSYFQPSSEAFELAKNNHRYWHQLSNAAQKLMARNSHQVLGVDLNTPSLFVVCWTPDGCESHQTRKGVTGGTGQAISIASKAGIPVFNLFNSGSEQRLHKYVVSLLDC
jgi:hypothetical protein